MTVVDDPRYNLRISGDGTWASVCRLRTDDVAAVFAEVRERAPHARVTWLTDATHDAELRTLGCRDQDPPLTSYITALATESAPPEVPDVEVRRIETADEYAQAAAVYAEGWGSARDERTREGWLAFVDGEPAAYAGAVPCARGIFLTGGVTLPGFRRRGAYRALVRARWDEAVRRGTPALVVHAEEASRRVLVRIGFEEVGRIVELVS